MSVVVRDEVPDEAGVQTSGDELNIVRGWVDAFNSRDMDALLVLTSQDCELRPYLATLIEGNIYRGHDGLRLYFADAATAWEEIQLKLRDDFREVGKCLVGSVDLYGRGRASHHEVQVPVVWVAKIVGAKVARIGAYGTEAEALEAARD
jgi:ketosteroid isomerase-like protein